MNSTTIRTEVAPDVYLVTRVTALLIGGEVASCSTTHLRFESEDHKTVKASEYSALASYWCDLVSGRAKEPDSLREAADDFVKKLENEQDYAESCSE
jgi:hypothetical protein